MREHSSDDNVLKLLTFHVGIRQKVVACSPDRLETERVPVSICIEPIANTMPFRAIRHGVIPSLGNACANSGESDAKSIKIANGAQPVMMDEKA